MNPPYFLTTWHRSTELVSCRQNDNWVQVAPTRMDIYSLSSTEMYRLSSLLWARCVGCEEPTATVDAWDHSTFIIILSSSWAIYRCSSFWIKTLGQTERWLQHVQQKFLSPLVWVTRYQLWTSWTELPLTNLVHCPICSHPTCRQSSERNNNSWSKQSSSSQFLPNPSRIASHTAEKSPMNKVRNNSRSRCIEQSLISLSKNLRIHSIDFLKRKQSNTSGKSMRSSVLNMLMVVMMMVMRLELSMLMRHSNLNLFLMSKRMNRMMRMPVFSLLMSWLSWHVILNMIYIE